MNQSLVGVWCEICVHPLKSLLAMYGRMTFCKLVSQNGAGGLTMQGQLYTDLYWKLLTKLCMFAFEVKWEENVQVWYMRANNSTLLQSIMNFTSLTYKKRRKNFNKSLSWLKICNENGSFALTSLILQSYKLHGPKGRYSIAKGPGELFWL